MKYIVRGNPIPLARHRIRGKRHYNPQAEIMGRVSYELYSQARLQPIINAALALSVVFYMPIPATWSKKKKEHMLGKPHNARPDLSNLIKFIEDCANEVLYTDDRLIVGINARKIYSDNPRTEIEVEPV